MRIAFPMPQTSHMSFAPSEPSAAPVTLSHPITPTAAQWDALFSYQRQKNLSFWPGATPQGSQSAWSSHAQLQAAAAALIQVQQTSTPNVPPNASQPPRPLSQPSQTGPVTSGLPDTVPVGIPGQPYTGYPTVAYQQVASPSVMGVHHQPYGVALNNVVPPRSAYPNGQITWQQPYSGPPQKTASRTGSATPAAVGPQSRSSSAVPSPTPTTATHQYAMLAPTPSGIAMQSTGTLSYSQLASMAATGQPVHKSS
jgi:hypothetical protein